MRSGRRAGYTLIEILIVIVLAALVMAGATVGYRAVTRANLRTACSKLVAASRFAYARSIAQGTTVRLALDLGSNELFFEEALGRVTLARPTGDRSRHVSVEGEENRDEAARSPWDVARARLANPLEPSPVTSAFSPISGSRYARQPVGDGIRIAKIFVPHEPEPRDRGVGAIYYFPAGQTEHAVVHVAEGETVWSVEVHPLTGRAIVRREPFEPRPPEDDLDDEDEAASEGDDQ